MIPKAALFLVAATALLALGAPYACGAPAAAEAHAIEGYVVEGGGSGKTLPVKDVDVTIVDGSGAECRGRTDEGGFFHIEIGSASSAQIRFQKHGYTLIACPNVSGPDGGDLLSIDLAKTPYDAETGTYSLTSGPDGWQCAIMAASSGIVRGTVSYEKGWVAGAVVSASPVSGGASYTATTDDRGNYEIQCPTGRYLIQVSCQGFAPSEASEITLSSNPSSLSVTLSKSPVKTYFGLDMAHVLMLIGIALGTLLVVSTWALMRHTGTHRRIEVLEDLEEPDDQDDGVR
ncbi:MAG: carboxypeptidase-like regulatory domain-containing protein [Candidatus Methanoplasma sp.]|jgi:hypothetical protein|nr:carboxypeptidase-like regulatory domain-containing protein [Candidatus Methanoplasma sp.]